MINGSAMTALTMSAMHYQAAMHARPCADALIQYNEPNKAAFALFPCAMRPVALYRRVRMPQDQRSQAEQVDSMLPNEDSKAISLIDKPNMMTSTGIRLSMIDANKATLLLWAAGKQINGGQSR